MNTELLDLRETVQLIIFSGNVKDSKEIKATGVPRDHSLNDLLIILAQRRLKGIHVQRQSSENIQGYIEVAIGAHAFGEKIPAPWQCLSLVDVPHSTQ